MDNQDEIVVDGEPSLEEVNRVMEEQKLLTLPERQEALRQLISVEKSADNSRIMLDNISKDQ